MTLIRLLLSEFNYFLPFDIPFSTFWHYPSMKYLLTPFLLLLAFAIKAEEIKTIHVLVALCDNQYQGIVSLP